MTALALEFKKIQSYDKTLYRIFYLNSKAETIINEVTLMMYLNQFIVLLYQTYKNL